MVAAVVHHVAVVHIYSSPCCRPVGALQGKELRCSRSLSTEAVEHTHNQLQQVLVQLEILSDGGKDPSLVVQQPVHRSRASTAAEFKMSPHELVCRMLNE